MDNDWVNHSGHKAYRSWGQMEPIPAEPVKERKRDLRVVWKRGALIAAAAIMTGLIVGIGVAVKLAGQKQSGEIKAEEKVIR